MWLILAIIVIWMARDAAFSDAHDEYKFPATDCDRGSFTDTGKNGFLGNLVAASSGSPACLLTDGVSSREKLRSEGSVSTLVAKSITEITLEMWVEPSNALTGDASIISFGKDGVQADGCTNNLVVSGRFPVSLFPS
jgi:hypothetical protein